MPIIVQARASVNEPESRGAVLEALYFKLYKLQATNCWGLSGARNPLLALIVKYPAIRSPAKNCRSSWAEQPSHDIKFNWPAQSDSERDKKRRRALPAFLRKHYCNRISRKSTIARDVIHDFFYSLHMHTCIVWRMSSVLAAALLDCLAFGFGPTAFRHRYTSLPP